MDWLDRATEYLEQENRFTYRDDEAKRIEPKATAHNITVIGCIKGIDGWYRAGYDENTKTIVPLDLIEKVREGE